MKKISLILLSIILIFTLAACGNKYELEADITALEAEKADLEAQKATLETAVSTLEAEKTTLTAKVAELEGEIDDLEEQVATLETNADADSAEISKLNADIATLAAEKETLSARITELEASMAEKNTEIANLNSSIATLIAEKQTLTNRVAELESENEALEEENAEFEIRINCLEGKHVINETESVSYVYTWSETAPTSVLLFTCLHCEKDVEETVSPSVWQAGDKVTYVAKDGNAYVSTVGEAAENKAVLVSDTDYSVEGKCGKEELTALLEPVGARFVVIDEESYHTIIYPWLSEVVVYSSSQGSLSRSFAYKESDQSTWYYLYKNALGMITYGNAWDAARYTNTWIYRYI